MPYPTLYALDTTRLSAFHRAVQAVLLAEDLERWAALVKQLQPLEASSLQLEVYGGRPSVRVTNERPGQLLRSAGLPELTPVELPDPRSPSLKYVLRRLSLLSAHHTLLGRVARFAGFFCTDLLRMPVAGTLTPPMLETHQAFSARLFGAAPSLPEDFWFLANGDAVHALALTGEIDDLIEAEDRSGLFAVIGEHYQSTGQAEAEELRTDLARIYHFLCLAYEEGLGVYYEEYST